MATYAELFDAFSDETLREKVQVAIWVTADKIKDELDTTPNHTNRAAFAKAAFAQAVSPTLVNAFMAAILATNEAVAIATILSATDTQIQSNVDAAVDIVAGI